MHRHCPGRQDCFWLTVRTSGFRLLEVVITPPVRAICLMEETMGLFDFLKKKEKSSATAPAKEAAQKENEPYRGDLEKTDILFHLVQVPQDQRDENWQQIFLENIGEASFRCGTPQVITGPDGFPYFQLFLPEPNKCFQCYVIDRMKDDFLLAQGFGVVINPTPNSADWVLSYGDILNFYLNKEFYTTTWTPFSKEANSETIAKDEELMFEQAAETILPQQARHVIAEFLKMNGVKSPKVSLMIRRRKDGKGISQELVFNLTPDDFKTENVYRYLMHTLGWYLPRHYSYAGFTPSVKNTRPNETNSFDVYT